MTITTSYMSLQQLGIPQGYLTGNPILMAQDLYTRQYHCIDSDTFNALTTDQWHKSELMSQSYSGNIALIDPATQIVAHIYDAEQTPQEELLCFDQLIAHEIVQHMSKQKGKP